MVRNFSWCEDPKRLSHGNLRYPQEFTFRRAPRTLPSGILLISRVVNTPPSTVRANEVRRTPTAYTPQANINKRLEAALQTARHDKSLAPVVPMAPPESNKHTWYAECGLAGDGAWSLLVSV